MSSSTIKRYIVILELLNTADENEFVPTSRFYQKLKENGLRCSSSTFNRDYKDLLALGFNIHSDKRKGYLLDRLETNNFDFLMTVFRRLEFNEILQKSTLFDAETHTYLELDSTSCNLEGFKWFDAILVAIKQRKEITFNLVSFYHRERKHPKTHTIKPYLLKEYNSRWYVIGESENSIKVYGLDRIQELEVLNNRPFVSKIPKVRDLMYYTVGLNFSETEPLKIILKFDISQKPYLESLKLHHSQQPYLVKDIDNTKFYMVKLFVVYNFELKQQILKYGSLVEVLEPPLIRADIVSEFRKMAQVYEQ